MINFVTHRGIILEIQQFNSQANGWNGGHLQWDLVAADPRWNGMKPDLTNGSIMAIQDGNTTNIIWFMIYIYDDIYIWYMLTIDFCYHYEIFKHMEPILQEINIQNRGVHVRGMRCMLWAMLLMPSWPLLGHTIWFHRGYRDPVWILGWTWFGSLLFASFCHIWCRNRNSLSFARLSGAQSLEFTGTLTLPETITRRPASSPQKSHQIVPILAEVTLCSWEGRALLECITWRFGSEGPCYLQGEIRVGVWTCAVGQQPTGVVGWDHGQHGVWKRAVGQQPTGVAGWDHGQHGVWKRAVGQQPTGVVGWDHGQHGVWKRAVGQQPTGVVGWNHGQHGVWKRAVGQQPTGVVGWDHGQHGVWKRAVGQQPTGVAGWDHGQHGSGNVL